MVGPIISCDATTGCKKQLFAASCDGKMDEQWSMAPLFIHFIQRTVEHALLFWSDRFGLKLKMH
jgi:hypothetical protein